MNRKKRIPLLLFLLLLLLIVCVWCHSENIVKNKATSLAALNSVVKEDIDFNFVKKENHLELTGNFSSDKSIQILHTALGDTKFNNLSNINKELVPKEGVVQLSQKLLLSFTQYYKDGSISYANGTLTVEGVVEDEAHKNAITTLLSNSSIDSKNNTRVVIPGPTAEELAEEKAKEEARLSALAEEEAKLKAQERAKEEAEKQAQLEAQEKAKEETRLATLAEEAKLEAKALEEKIKKILDFENINFELNKATLTESSINTVSHIATILKENPNVHIEIAGHSDSLGDDTYNLNLSQKRVDAVKEKLIQMEIPAERIQAVGYGENRPLVSNDTEENRRINRRVEFKVIGE